MNFNDFVGQDNIKDELIKIADHPTTSVLLVGNSGCGKTALARIFAGYRGDFDYVLADRKFDPTVLNPAALTHIIDEVHLLPTPEVLFPLMAERSFVFCTTESADLLETLRNRCITFRLEQYTLLELIRMILVRKPDFSIEVATLIASRSRETPRVSEILSDRVEISISNVTYRSTLDFLERVGIFDDGYTRTDLAYLNYLESLGGRPVGLSTISATLNLSPTIVKNEIEPYLIRRRRIMITSSGRVLNDAIQT